MTVCSVSEAKESQAPPVGSFAHLLLEELDGVVRLPLLLLPRPSELLSHYVHDPRQGLFSGLHIEEREPESAGDDINRGGGVFFDGVEDLVGDKTNDIFLTLDDL